VKSTKSVFWRHIQKFVTFDCENVFPSSFLGCTLKDVEFPGKKKFWYKYHKILFLEVPNPSTIVEPFWLVMADFEPTANHGREGCVPNECGGALGPGLSDTCGNGSVQTTRTASDFFRKVNCPSWLSRDYTKSASNWTKWLNVNANEPYNSAFYQIYLIFLVRVYMIAGVIWEKSFWIWNFSLSFQSRFRLILGDISRRISVTERLYLQLPRVSWH